MTTNIFQWNAGGLAPKLSELKNTVDHLKPDVLVIQEYSTKPDYNKILKISGYQPPLIKAQYRLAIYVKNEIQYKENTNYQNLPVQSLELYFKNNTKLNLYNIYLKPSLDNDQFSEIGAIKPPAAKG